MLTPAELQVLATSFAVASKALLVLPLAILVAFALSRPRLPGRFALDALAHLPVILPPVLVGFGLLLIFARHGLLGGIFPLAFTQNGAALATALMIFPILVRSIRISFEATDARLFEAAAVLGASPVDRFVTIALPLALPGIVAGVVTAVAAGMGGVGGGLTFSWEN